MSVIQTLYKPDLPGYPAVWSPCRRYRYTLWRPFGFSKSPSYIAWIGLNPSTATEEKDDNTVRRCMRFSVKWGYEAMVMLNAFAWRDTDPKGLLSAADPVGPDNNKWIREVCCRADKVLCCWGAHGRLGLRDSAVLTLLKRDGVLPSCLALNQDGTPLHPLYTSSKLIPQEMPL